MAVSVHAGIVLGIQSGGSVLTVVCTALPPAEGSGLVWTSQEAGADATAESMCHHGVSDGTGQHCCTWWTEEAFGNHEVFDWGQENVCCVCMRAWFSWAWAQARKIEPFSSCGEGLRLLCLSPQLLLKVQMSRL